MRASEVELESAPLILIVDDDADIRETLAEYLADEGYEVLCAQNGREALDQLHGSAAPRLILLDLSMPVMDGFQFLAEQMKEPNLAKIPVVIVTAGQQHRDLPAGVPVVTKPMNLDKLVSLIRTYCT